MVEVPSSKSGCDESAGRAHRSHVPLELRPDAHKYLILLRQYYPADRPLNLTICGPAGDSASNTWLGARHSARAFWSTRALV